MAYLDYATIIVWILVAVIMYINVLLSDCDLKKKIALTSYEVASAIMIILTILSDVTHSSIYLPAIADVSLLFPLYIIFYSIYMDFNSKLDSAQAMVMGMSGALTAVS